MGESGLQKSVKSLASALDTSGNDVKCCRSWQRLLVEKRPTESDSQNSPIFLIMGVSGYLSRIDGNSAQIPSFV